MLRYKPGATEVIERLRQLYERRAADRVFATMGVPSAVLAEFAREHPAGFCEYPDPAERALSGSVSSPSARRSRMTRCRPPT